MHRRRRCIVLAFSPVRTLTVGSGISPDLLTPACGRTACGALAGSARNRAIPPVGNSTPPRELRRPRDRCNATLACGERGRGLAATAPRRQWRPSAMVIADATKATHAGRAGRGPMSAMREPRTSSKLPAALAVFAGAAILAVVYAGTLAQGVDFGT